MHDRTARLFAIAAILSVMACDSPAPEKASGVSPAETEVPVSATTETSVSTVEDLPPFPANFRALGTEPFWAIHVNGDKLRYMTPEDQEGQQVAFSREQSDQNELALTAELNGEPLVLRVRFEECSDGMSDRVYPFTVIVSLGDKNMKGCARPSDL